MPEPIGKHYGLKVEKLMQSTEAGLFLFLCKRVIIISLVSCVKNCSLLEQYNIVLLKYTIAGKVLEEQ